MEVDGSKIIFWIRSGFCSSNSRSCIVFLQFVKDKSLKKSKKSLSATNEFKITQIVDNGQDSTVNIN